MCTLSLPVRSPISGTALTSQNVTATLVWVQCCHIPSTVITPMYHAVQPCPWYSTWGPVTSVRRVLRLRMEERPPDMPCSCARTTEGWYSSWGRGGGEGAENLAIPDSKIVPSYKTKYRGSDLVGSSERGNEPSGSIQCKEFD
jgi:hypothetical protein